MIKVDNVGKIYKNGEIVALQNVSLDIEEGSIVGVIGRNGAGKSTLFKIISGVINDYTGNCFINGVRSSINFSNKISYLPEVRGLDGRMQVLEHLTDIVCYKGVKRNQAKKNVEHWLEEFRLAEYKYRRIDTFSKGNQQKLQFIAAIASNPEILILDEPFSGLDAITTDFFWNIITKLRSNGCTIIFSTHNLNDRLSDCDKFLFLVKGKAVEYGTLEEIQSRYHMVLEIQNNSLEIKMLYDIVDKEQITQVNDLYHINISNKDVAKKIFDLLDNKFCERFYVRKICITELFRELNGGII